MLIEEFNILLNNIMCFLTCAAKLNQKNQKCVIYKKSTYNISAY